MSISEESARDVQNDILRAAALGPEPALLSCVAAKSNIRIGISGWTYPPWRGTFYPEKLPQNRELAYASRQVNSIEINGSFYSLQRPSSFIKWYQAVPDDFVFSVKANRYITHVLRLRNCRAPLANFFASGVLALNEKLGSVLWQFPPSMKLDLERMEEFLAMLPTDAVHAKRLAENCDPWMRERAYFEVNNNWRIRHAFEVRHASFRNSAFLRLLRKFKAALVFSDSGGKWPYIEEVTADFIYIRLHGAEELYASGYNTRALKTWARRIRSWQARNTFVYFDNDAKVFAPFNAVELHSLLTDFVAEDETLFDRKIRLAA